MHAQASAILHALMLNTCSFRMLGPKPYRATYNLGLCLPCYRAPGDTHVRLQVLEPERQSCGLSILSDKPRVGRLSCGTNEHSLTLVRPATSRFRSKHGRHQFER